MNPKIDKFRKEIVIVEEKIASLQSKKKELEKQLADYENEEIIGMVRALRLTPEQLAAMLKNAKAPSPTKEEFGIGKTEE